MRASVCTHPMAGGVLWNIHDGGRPRSVRLNSPNLDLDWMIFRIAILKGLESNTYLPTLLVAT